MSKYEWERGEIVIPTNQWAKFRTAIIKAFNERQSLVYQEALKLFEKVKLAKKGKRNFDFGSWFNKEANEHRSLSFSEVCQIEYQILKRVDGKYKLIRPKKNMFAPLPTSKGCSIDCDDSIIVLNNKKRSVIWSVEENNHSVDRARSCHMGRVLFRLLDNIKWTRGSGGTIVGNDEYNRDDYSEYGGGNYVVAEYGKKSKSKIRRW